MEGWSFPGAMALMLLLASNAHIASGEASFSSSKLISPLTRLFSTPSPPVWPQTYTLKYEVSMPHFFLTQPNGLKFPVTVWYSGPTNQMRVEVLGGLDTIITTRDVEYTLYPRINETRCGIFDVGPRASDVAGASNSLSSVLPDLKGWDFGGEATIDGKQAYIWQYQHKDDDKISQYMFYTTPSGEPVKFIMMGVNYLTNGHFDAYNYDFTHYSTQLEWPLPPSWLPPTSSSSISSIIQSAASSATQANPLPPVFKRDTVVGKAPFSPPSICDSVSTATGDLSSSTAVESASRGGRGGKVDILSQRHPVTSQILALTPQVRSYDYEAAYHAFSRSVHIPHALRKDNEGAGLSLRPHTQEGGAYRARLQRFQATVERVKEHNADPTKTYKQKVHRWADWSEEEFLSVMLPNKQRKAAMKEAGLLEKIPDSYKPIGKFKRHMPRHQLPKTVDWRGTGADPGVKDQGMCGSCFAFSATGSLEGVWYVSTGQHRSFSEQQIIDCAWEYGPNGCGGGDYQPVFNYAALEGGLALEQDYPYLSNNAFCEATSHPRPGQFEGFLAIPSRDEVALMEAVYTLGPVAVAVDAEFASFRSYSEGVYSDPDCAIASADLDHAVVLYGYGTTKEGIDYWLVRNSWAKFYGDDGYIKIKRGHGDCGISTDPAVAVVKESAVVNGMAEKNRLQAVREWN